MKIKKMTARFGTLSGQTLTPGDGLNIIYAPNESGKSTWCAFLRAMLYGVSTSQRAKGGQQPDKVRYQPWNGEPMSGSMDVRCADGDVTVSRWTDRADRPMQAFSAFRTGTREPVAGITGDNAGERLTGMTRAVFERSVFIGQTAVEIGADPELDKRISAIVTDGDEAVSYIETEKRMRTWLRHRRSGKRGALPELEATMAETRRAIGELDALAARSRTLDDDLARTQEKLASDTRTMEETRSRLRQEMLQMLQITRQEASSAEEDARAAEDAVSQAEDKLKATPYALLGPEEARQVSDSDRSDAAELLRLAMKIPPVKLAFIPLALGALAFILAVFLPWHIECAGVGCILALLFVVMYTRLLSLRNTKEDTLAQRQKILDCYGVSDPDEIEGLLEIYRSLWQVRERAVYDREKADKALERAQARRQKAEELVITGLDFVNGDNDAARALRVVERDKEDIHRIRDEQTVLRTRTEAIGDRMSLASALEEQTRRHERLTEQEAALELALSVLEDADGELQQRLSPVLAKKASEYFSALTGERYDELTFSRDLIAQARPEGETVSREAGYFSRGTRDQLYLALRLAVCELALPHEDACPLILDDVLVNFDETRMERALTLLRSMAEQRQILLFTCHEREKRFFARDHSVTKLTLEE